MIGPFLAEDLMTIQSCYVFMSEHLLKRWKSNAILHQLTNLLEMK